MPKKHTLKSRHKKSMRSRTKHNRTKHSKVYKKKHSQKTRKHSKKYKRHNKIMRGGYGPGAGPVGYSWKGDSSTWPGAYASSGGNTNGMTFSNHYSYNSQGTGVGGLDPAMSTRGDLAELNYQKGGGVVQDLFNLGDSTKYNVSDFVSKLYATANSPTDPDVTKQFIDENHKIISTQPIDVNKITIESANAASKL